MMFFKSGVLSITVVLISLTSAQAFTLILGPDDLTPNRGWGRNEVVFDYSLNDCPSESEFFGILDKAIAVWNGATTSALVVRRGSEVTESASKLMDLTHAPANPVMLCSKNFPKAIAGSVLGYADVAINSNLNVQYAYLVLNNKSDSKANAFASSSAAAVVAHEMGHVLGLGHSQDNTALMWYAADDEAEATLIQDDIDGISYLHPRKEPNDGKVFGCGTVDVGSSAGPGPGSFLVLLVWMATYVGYRSKLTKVRE